MFPIPSDMKRRFPRGVQKYIRKEKARIRRDFFDREEREEHIQKMYAKFSYMEPKQAEGVKK